MSQWPQYVVVFWLIGCIVSSLAMVLREPRGRITLAPKQQRISALLFGLGALGEAQLLIAGGFFKGLF